MSVDRNSVEFEEAAVSVDAALIAEDLGLEPAGLIEALRAGRVTAVCEQGIAQDAGRFRLTFYHRDRRLRLIIDPTGQVLERAAARLRRRLSQLRRASGSD
jgi:hypothetical protein